MEDFGTIPLRFPLPLVVDCDNTLYHSGYRALFSKGMEKTMKYVLLETSLMLKYFLYL